MPVGRCTSSLYRLVIADLKKSCLLSEPSVPIFDRSLSWLDGMGLLSMLMPFSWTPSKHQHLAAKAVSQCHRVSVSDPVTPSAVSVLGKVGTEGFLEIKVRIVR